jgi:hypothetical protein
VARVKWSYSSHRMMRKCQRQYAFARLVAAHNATDPNRREAYILKQLQSLAAWQGSIVHKVLASDFLADLRAGRLPDATRLTDAAHNLATRQFAFSEARRYREPGMSKAAAGNDYCALFDHERGREVAPVALESTFATISDCFHNLAGKRAFLEELLSGYGHEAELRVRFNLDDVNVESQLDLVFWRPDRGLSVVDWKVSREETSENAFQLLTYAIAASRSQRWPGISATDIHLYEANLLKNEIRAHSASAERLEEAEDFIYRGVLGFKALLGNGTVSESDLEEFEVANKPTTCMYCNFGPLCIERLETTCRISDAEVIQGRLW